MLSDDVLAEELSYQDSLERDELQLHQQLQQDLAQWNGLARQRLSASKALRQRAEQDAQLLANRLRLLRSEEAKALRIIEEVRKRTKEVLEQRMNSQQMLQDQSSYKESSQQAIEKKREENNWRRVQARFARQQAQEERVSANRRCVSEIRAEQRRASSRGCDRPPSLASSTVASEEAETPTVKVVPAAPPRGKVTSVTVPSAELLAEERELLARLRRSDAAARVRRPALPPVALQDEGPIKAALREASFMTPR